MAVVALVNRDTGNFCFSGCRLRAIDNVVRYLAALPLPTTHFEVVSKRRRSYPSHGAHEAVVKSWISSTSSVAPAYSS